MNEHRQRIVAMLFVASVERVLHQHHIYFSTRMMHGYRESLRVLYDSHTEMISVAWIKKQLPDRPNTMVILRDHPYVYYNIVPNWKEDPNTRSVIKILISLIGEVNWVQKIFLPPSRLDPNPEKWSWKECENYRAWDIPAEYAVRKSKHGIKCNLFIPYYPEKDLGKWVLSKQLSSLQVLSISAQLWRLLGQWHGRGVVHLDIKLGNLVYDSKGDTLHIIDREQMMKIGKRYRAERVTEHYMHPSIKRALANGERVWAEPTHDIYAGMMTMLYLLVEAQKNEKIPERRQWLGRGVKVLANMLYLPGQPPRMVRPLEKLPSIEILSTFVSTLQDKVSAVEEKVLPHIRAKL